MSFSTEKIVQDLRAEFESMLQYVQESQELTADAVERSLFRQLLALGARLMLLFFRLRAGECEHKPIVTSAGGELTYHSEKKRNYYSIFGKLPWVRPYFYAQGSGGVSPLDEQLSLGDDCYSDLVRELAEYLGVDGTYAKVSHFFARLLGQSLSTQAISRLVAEDAGEVEAYYDQKPAPAPAQEAAILVVQADGKGVPMVRATAVVAKVRLGKGDKRSQKKEAVVTTCYTIAPHPRTPEAVVASFFGQEAPPIPSVDRPSPPQNKLLWATLAGKEAALGRLARYVAEREGAHIQHRVALTDGCEALQQRVAQYLPHFTLVLDFLHASEYLWKAANSLFGEQSPQRDPWVEQQALQMLSGHTDQVIAALQTFLQQPKRTQAQRKVLTSVANYFQRNRPFMHYDHYLAQGWPIASGVIEGACRHFVKDRCELSGMRWTPTGVENLLRLRAVAENGDWEDYHRFRKQRRHLRLYGSPLPDPVDPEQRALAQPDSDKIIRFDRTSERRPRRLPPEQRPLAA